MVKMRVIWRMGKSVQEKLVLSLVVTEVTVIPQDDNCTVKKEYDVVMEKLSFVHFNNNNNIETLDHLQLQLQKMLI